VEDHGLPRGWPSRLDEVEELGLDVPEMGLEGYPSSPEVSTVLVMAESVTVPTEAATFEPQPEAV